MIIGAVVVLLLLYIAGVFNGISKRRNQIENAISSLDALFIQRAELIPNLIETAKQYMAFEKETLTKIAELRKPINLSDITESDNPYAGTEQALPSKRLCYKQRLTPNWRATSSLTTYNGSSPSVRSSYQLGGVSSVLLSLIITML